MPAAIRYVVTAHRISSAGVISDLAHRIAASGRLTSADASTPSTTVTVPVAAADEELRLTCGMDESDLNTHAMRGSILAVARPGAVPNPVGAAAVADAAPRFSVNGPDGLVRVAVVPGSSFAIVQGDSFVSAGGSVSAITLPTVQYEIAAHRIVRPGVISSAPHRMFASGRFTLAAAPRVITVGQPNADEQLRLFVGLDTSNGDNTTRYDRGFFALGEPGTPADVTGAEQAVETRPRLWVAGWKDAVLSRMIVRGGSSFAVAATGRA